MRSYLPFMTNYDDLVEPFKSEAQRKFLKRLMILFGTTIDIVICLMAIFTVFLLMAGCTQKDLLQPHPQAPALITDSKGRIQVSYLDPATNQLVNYGWVPASSFDGWTLTPFNWSEITDPN